MTHLVACIIVDEAHFAECTVRVQRGRHIVLQQVLLRAELTPARLAAGFQVRGRQMLTATFELYFARTNPSGSKSSPRSIPSPPRSPRRRPGIQDGSETRGSASGDRPPRPPSRTARICASASPDVPASSAVEDILEGHNSYTPRTLAHHVELSLIEEGRIALGTFGVRGEVPQMDG